MNSFTQKPFFTRSLCFLLLSILGINFIGRIGSNYLRLPRAVVVVIALIWLISVLAVGITLNRRVRTGRADGGRVQALWEGALRYLIALDMLIFGVGKIFHQQFKAPLGMLDVPLSQLSGDMQLWVFFGQHDTYPVLIALLQITSGLLLLFRRTRLFGLVFLLPILLNIIVLNQYYDFGIPVDEYTIMMALAVIYLILLEYTRLSEFFFKLPDVLPVYPFKNILQKRTLQLVVISFPLLLMAFRGFTLFFPDYAGKYVVKTLTINNQKMPKPVSSRDSILTAIYIDRSDDDFVLDYNDYRRRMIGSYQYKKADSSFRVIWRYPAGKHDTLYAQLLPGPNKTSKVFKGRMGNENFLIEAKKVR